MDQAEREKREAARGANSNQPRYWIRTFPFLTPFHPLFPVPLLSFPIFRSLCYSATLLFSKAGPLIPSNPRATNPSRSTVIIVSREKTTLSLFLSLSFKRRATWQAIILARCFAKIDFRFIWVMVMVWWNWRVNFLCFNFLLEWMIDLVWKYPMNIFAFWGVWCWEFEKIEIDKVTFRNL